MSGCIHADVCLFVVDCQVFALFLFLRGGHFHLHYPQFFTFAVLYNRDSSNCEFIRHEGRQEVIFALPVDVDQKSIKLMLLEFKSAYFGRVVNAYVEYSSIRIEKSSDVFHDNRRDIVFYDVSVVFELVMPVLDDGQDLAVVEIFVLSEPAMLGCVSLGFWECEFGGREEFNLFLWFCRNFLFLLCYFFQVLFELRYFSRIFRFDLVLIPPHQHFNFLYLFLNINRPLLNMGSWHGKTPQSIQMTQILSLVDVRTPLDFTLLSNFSFVLKIAAKSVFARNCFVHIRVEKMFDHIGGHLCAIEILEIGFWVNQWCFWTCKWGSSLILSWVVVGAVQLEIGQAHIMIFITFFSLEFL